MIVSRKYKDLAKKVSSKDATRYNLQSVWADKDAGALIATNGHILASVEADDIERSALIHPDAYNRAHKLCDRSDGHASINLADEGSRTKDGETIPYQAGQFPNWRQIEYADTSGKVPITFNPQLLHDLSKALGVDKTGGVTLWVDPKNPCSAMRVEIFQKGHEKNKRTFGVLMPMRA